MSVEWFKGESRAVYVGYGYLVRGKPITGIPGEARLKRFRNLIGIIVMCAILGATLIVPATSAAPLMVKLDVTRAGELSYLSLVTPFPITVDFSVNNSVPGATFFWQFGDGSNGTGPTPTHAYNYSCVYDIQVQVTTGNGSVFRGEVVFGAFTYWRLGGGTIAVCPPQGTAGLIPVELAGGLFPANQQVSILLNGTTIGTVTADGGGDWTFAINSFLTPEPNATQYSFTTSPASLTADFTTVEGIRVTPTTGAPGTSVEIEGRSYPPHQSVLVYLGGANLGTAQTDGSGSFLMQVQIPFVSPLVSASTYPYSTLPAILGSQASFASAGVTMTVTESTTFTVTQTTTQPTTTTQIRTQNLTTTRTTTTTTTTTVTASTFDYAALGAAVIVILTVTALTAWVLRGRRL